MRIRSFSRFGTGGSIATIAAALVAPHSARADGFQGTPTVASGLVSFDRTPTTSETVTLDSPRAVINWAPYDVAGTGPIDFLPAANSILFQGGSALGSPQVTPYFVLNRIIPLNPTRPIVFNGTLTDAGIGGGLFFYSPGGIVLGSTARLDVASLLLTTADLPVDVNGEFLPGGNSFTVNGAAGSTSLIDIQAGARIDALSQGSFVVAVAPRVNHAGTITVNGSAALVSAQSATFTFNAGLFDIIATQGTDAAGTTLSSTGEISGAASSGVGDRHRVYMMAIPKNDAITLFLAPNGNLGFDVAGAADISGNAIVLSAGHNITELSNGTPFSFDPVNATPASVAASGGNYTSYLTARASSNVDFTAGASTPINLASDIFLSGKARAQLGAAPGSTLNVAGDVGVFSIGEGFGSSGANQSGGVANFFTDVGATTTVGGNVFVDASAFGESNNSGAGNGGDAFGGNASLNVSGGLVTIAGFVNVRAAGTGGDNSNGSGSSGSSTGGTALIFSHDSGGSEGRMVIGSDVFVSASALAPETVFAGISGGNATAGQGTLIANFGGEILVNGNVSVEGRAIGSPNGNAGSGIGGTAIGSSFSQIAAAQPGASVTIVGNASIDTSAFGGPSESPTGVGGSGTGGTSALGATDAIVTIGGSVSLIADGFGGEGSNGAAGGTGTGGNANSFPVTNGIVSLTGTAQNVIYSARGQGGNGSIGGQGQGGNAQVGPATGAVFVTPANLSLDARGIGGAGANGNGGNGVGGTAAANSGLNAALTLGGGVQILAGGFGGSSDIAARGGNGTGGTARMLVVGANGAIDVSGGVLLDATAQGGSALSASASPLSIGGNAAGGLAELAMANAGSDNGAIDIGQNITVLTSAIGGNGGSGGNATGGNLFVSAQNGGSLTIAGTDVTLDSSGRGGDGDGGRGGDGSAGQINMAAISSVALGPSTLFAGNVSATARGVGGNGGEFLGQTGAGGTGRGNIVGVFAQQANGQLTVGDVRVDTRGIGGSGGAASSIAVDTGKAGGDAFGGFATVGLVSGLGIATPSGFSSIGNVTIDARATGGTGGAGNGAAGGAGGNATGGDGVLLARGGPVNALAITIDADAIGGRGGNGVSGGAGGSATGGSAGLRATPHFTSAQPASFAVSNLDASATAVGGDGGSASGGTAGAGGAAQGGSAILYLTPSESVGAAPSTNSGTGTVTGTVRLDTLASGGGSAGVAGAARGGTSEVVVDGGTLSLGGRIDAIAEGLGGVASGAGSVGGAGQGGNAQLFSLAGSLAVAQPVALFARGVGGTGAAGGAGSGGAAQISPRNGALSISGAVQLFANGVGGAGLAGFGGRGGDGIGGTATLSVGAGATVNAPLSVGGATLAAAGFGGAGGSGSSGVAGGRGGDGTGGLARSGSATSAGLVTVDTAIVQAVGVGGDGGAGGPGAAGGSGGNGRGGTAATGTESGPSPATGTLSWQAVQHDARGFGGAGGSGTIGGNGGSGTGGTASLGSAGGTVSVAGPATQVASGIGGNAATGGAGGTGQGGTSILGVQPHPTAGQTSATSAGVVNQFADGLGGTGATPGFGYFGRNRVNAGGGTLSVTSLRSTGIGSFAPVQQLAGGYTVSAGGVINVGGDAFFSTPGDAVLAVDGGAINIGGILDFQVGRNLIRSLVATPPVSPGAVLAQSIFLSAAGSIDTFTGFSAQNVIVAEALGGGITIGNLTSVNGIDLNAIGPIVTGNVSGGDLLQFTSTTGSLTSTSIRSDDDIEIVINGSLNLGSISAGDSVDIQATGTVTIGAIDAGIVNPSTDPTATYRVGISAPGNVTTGAITARSDIGLLSTGGSVQTGNLSSLLGGVGILSGAGVTTGGITTSTGTGGVVYIADQSMVSLLGPNFDPSALFAATPVRLPGSISINGSVATGELVAAARGGIAVQGGITAVRRIFLDSGGLVSFGGASSAPIITVNSADIAIGSGGTLGDANTTQLTLTADPAASSIALGGSPSSGYAFDSAEMQRIRAQAITIAPLSGSAGITIGQFTLQGSGAAANLVGANGSLSVSTPGSIRVNGSAVIENALSGTTFNLTAGGRIEIVHDAGGRLIMRGAGSDFAGILNLQATNIWSATSAVLGQLSDDPEFTGRDAILGRSSFAVPTPIISARTIRFGVGEKLLIQNSGNALQRAGFAVGTGGLTITGLTGRPPVTTPIEMIINGTAQSPTGETVINQETVDLLTIPQPSDPRPLLGTSSVNGCLIGATVCLTTGNDPIAQTSAEVATEAQVLAEAMDDAEREQANDAVEKSVDVRMSRLVNTNAITTPNPINEPVTGAGNPSLWGSATGNTPEEPK